MDRWTGMTESKMQHARLPVLKLEKNENLLQAGDSSRPPGQSSTPSHTALISIQCVSLLGHSH